VFEGLQETALKSELVQAIRVLANGGILTLMVGHASVRMGDKALILGHAHKSGKTLNQVTEDDIVSIDLDGSLVEGRLAPPGERFIHSEIYRARPDVGAVVHAHPLASLPFGVAGVDVIPVFARAVPLGPRVPVLDYPGQIDTGDKGKMVAQALGSGKALLLRGHGTVVVGDTLEEACVNSFMLEMNAEVQFRATLLGQVKAVTPEEAGVSQNARGYKPTSAWSYFVDKYA
jgi:ribulose-5-phosphate 4-epimerase/fuculose-1-phosphate aldolase